MAVSDDVSALYTRITETATAYIDDYVAAHDAKDPQLLSKHLSPSCVRRLAPAAFLRQAPPEIAAGWSNAAYEAHMKREIDAYSSVTAKIERLVVDVNKCEAVVQSRHICTMASQDRRVWEFEFMFMLSFDRSGERIKEIVQFIDTATAAEFLASTHVDAGN